MGLSGTTTWMGCVKRKKSQGKIDSTSYTYANISTLTFNLTVVLRASVSRELTIQLETKVRSNPTNFLHDLTAQLLRELKVELDNIQNYYPIENVNVSKRLRKLPSRAKH